MARQSISDCSECVRMKLRAVPSTCKDDDEYFMHLTLQTVASNALLMRLTTHSTLDSHLTHASTRNRCEIDVDLRLRHERVSGDVDGSLYDAAPSIKAVSI